MGNRAKLLGSALELFNDQGTRAVSTNHIAKAAEVSPGNLYYHFKNKGEIIRHLFIEFSTGCSQAIPQSEPPLIGSIEQMNQFLGQIKKIEWRYRFFGREMGSLLDIDPELRVLFLEVQSARLSMIEGSIRGMIHGGLAVDLDEQTIQRLAEMIWLVSVFWNPYLALKGESITEERMAESGEMVKMLVAPYLIHPQ